MYLREMGGVELLSREGEIAIAKRIVAGKDYMINGLFQSPLSAKKVFEWREKLEKNELLVREIIDIDSTYIETETEDQNLNLKKAKTSEKKEINDKLGHQVGDLFLIHIANALGLCIREHDLLARLGGDEFVILLTHIYHRHEAIEVAERIIDSLSRPFQQNNNIIN